jgi:hypothetical protein
VETEQEVETLVAGGMIPLILDRHLAELVVPKTPDFVRPIPGGAFTKEGSK